MTIDLKEETIAPYGVFEAQAHGKPEGTMLRMTCYTADYAQVAQGKREIEELRWIGSDCPRSDLSVTSAIVLEDLKSKDLID